MVKLKAILAMIACGFSTFNLNPNTDYTQYVKTPEQISNEAWQRTGNALRDSINKVGTRIGKRNDSER